MVVRVLMRVTGGIAKSVRLRAPRSARPTTDMTRQAVFNILGDAVVDARVLDLFAGAGTLGIEALSRGAREALFVDNDREACSTILQNLEATKLRSSAQIRRADVGRLLAKPARTPFDLAFLDPPYDRGLGFLSRVLGRIAEGSWVREGGTVVVEAEQGHLEWPLGFRETRTRRFGRTQMIVAVRDGTRARSDLPRDF